MKSVYALAFTTLLAAQAAIAGTTDARKALKEISAERIAADYETVLKEMLPNTKLSGEQITSYTFCPKDKEMSCMRYVLYTVAKTDSVENFAVALEYSADQQNSGEVKVEQSWNWQVGEASIDNGNKEIALMALAQLEKDYKTGAPIKGHVAHHPFRVQVTHVASQSEANGTGDDLRWDGSSNYLVHFHEGNDTRVVAYTFGYTYLVRTKTEGDVIKKSDIRKVLKLDELLK